jgi:hypothetical protein
VPISAAAIADYRGDRGTPKIRRSGDFAQL